MTLGNTYLVWTVAHVRSTPAIDRSVLGEWLADDDAAIDELLAVFRDSICAEFAKMRELLVAGQLSDYADAAHRLRGAALSMGARALAEFVGFLFTAAQSRDDDACVNGMAILETHVQLVEAEMPRRRAIRRALTNTALSRPSKWRIRGITIAKRCHRGFNHVVRHGAELVIAQAIRSS